MTSLFTSSGYSATENLELENGEGLTLANLPAFLRVLLITDGTVTKSLESFFWEPVKVLKQRQVREPLKHSLSSLSLSEGAETIVREVNLQGEHSKKIYAHALSYIRTDSLPEFICSDLESGRLGIGELLRESGLETYRELLRFGKEQQGSDTLITRCYRIIMNRQAAIEITEKFPLRIYS